MGWVKWVQVLLAFLLFVPAVSAHYYVVLDERLAGLYPYACEVANLHNGTVVISNFSNFSFLGPNDYVLFVVNSSRFERNFVYSIYRRLDRNGDGIYDPAVGFYPVEREEDFAGWARALRSFRPGKALFIEAGSFEYGEYVRAAEKASLVWIGGHGSPSGVDMGWWRFDRDHMGEPVGRAFVFESCDVGEVWKSNASLVLALLRRGSPAVVASVEMGGVSYLSSGFWASGYPLGKLVQISNAYFRKVGIHPKAVLFGDPALLPVSSPEYSVSKKPASGIYAMIFPPVNGEVYMPGGSLPVSLFRAYGHIFNPLDLWKSVVTLGGVGPIIPILGAVLLLRQKKPDREEACWVAASSAILLLFLGILWGYPPVGASLLVLLTWAVALLLSRLNLKWGFLFLFLPPSLVVSLALLAGYATSSYWAFTLFVSLLTSLFLLGLLLGMYRAFQMVSAAFR
ncbi:hypothetical protein [Thermococcus aciditolerans]|uniref:Uncharacterized protein n=1 Tax=Thermococcus aciditolerans TaxID=2598455 RepID=A0A5C0SQQ3_9EURY|nr:hypothetical protein [Thermococcus aciditolerans]QEK15209.1 hypothetical protein FPV09_09010 [Thermococcus aciditolerans]